MDTHMAQLPLMPDASSHAAGARPLLTASAATVAMLAALAALGQFANSVYLPSFPAMEAALATDAAHVQLTLAAFLIPFGVGQLVAGPLADRYGRRPILFGGLLVFLAATVACGLAQSVDVLIAGRAVQGLGACTGVIVARAVVRDAFDGDEMGRVMGMISMAFTAVPALAPFLGGAAQDLVGWRASFALAALAGVAVFAVAFRRLPETNPSFGASLNLAGRYGPVLRSPVFLGYTALSAAALGGVFAFHAGAPHLFIAELGVSATEFGVYPSLTVTGFLLGAWMVRRYLLAWGERRLMVLGAALLVAAPSSMIAAIAWDALAVWPMVGAMWVFVWGMGITVPLSIAGAIRGFPERAGTAAAALGFCQMLAAAAGTALVSALAPLGHAAFPTGMLVLAAIGFSALVFLRHEHAM